MKTESKTPGFAHHLIAGVKSIFLWCYWYPFKWTIQRVPVHWTYRLANLMARCLYVVSVRKRKRLVRQLNRLGIFELESSRVERVVREAFWVLTCNELEVLLYPVMNPAVIASF